MDPRVHQTELCNVNLGFSLTDLSLLPVVLFAIKWLEIIRKWNDFCQRKITDSLSVIPRIMLTTMLLPPKDLL